MVNEDQIGEMFLELCEIYKLWKKSKKRTRRWGVQPINRDWKENGYQCLDEEQLFFHTRMTRPVFNLLVKLIGKSLRKPKQRIPVAERLSLTLSFLAHGTSFQCIARRYKLGKTTVRKIILETCEVLWRLLSPMYVSEPTESKYKGIAKDFFDLWNIPNCVGAIDGKHISIKCPTNSGSMSDKKFFSIVLMAACDANYTFTAISIGSNGSQSDGGIFQMSPFGQALMANTLPLPPDTPLCSQSPQPFPHFFVGDTAFPLKRNLMRPYPGSNLSGPKRIFNYRLSRARRVIENSFGILTSRWRVLHTAIECNAENAETFTLACIALHNFIMLNDHQRWYCPEHYTDWEGEDNVLHDGEWRRQTDSHLQPMTSAVRRGPVEAVQLRDKLADYFINEGAVPFQDSIDIRILGP